MYQILSCGSNGNYQLGLDNDEDQSILQPATFMLLDPNTNELKPNTKLESKPIKITCGGNHTLVLFESGEVYGCGANDNGQIGRKEKEEELELELEAEQHHCFRIIHPPTPKGVWTDIACSWECSYLVCDKKKVYSLGRGNKGELGLGLGVLSNSDINLGLLREFEYPVTKIKSSLNHVLLQTNDGKLYGWGSCRKGQLGDVLDPSLIKRGAIWQPVALHFTSEDNNLDMSSLTIDDFVLGRDYTVFLKREKHGKLEIYGRANIDKDKLDMCISCDKDYKIEKIESMWSSIHVKINNEIKSYGVNTHGQLYNYKFPHSIEHLKDCYLFVVGSEHGLLLADNKVFAWGWGEHGNCGSPNYAAKACSTHSPETLLDDITFDYLNPLYTGQDKVHLIAGGCATSWVVIESETELD